MTCRQGILRSCWRGLTVAAWASLMAPGQAEVGPAGPAVDPQPAVVQPRNSGPEAVAHSRTRQYRRKTVRVIRRTPDVMREDAARYRRGDIFSTWSNRYKE